MATTLAIQCFNLDSTDPEALFGDLPLMVQDKPVLAAVALQALLFGLELARAPGEHGRHAAVAIRRQHGVGQALQALDGIDTVLATLAKAAEDAPRVHGLRARAVPSRRHCGAA